MDAPKPLPQTIHFVLPHDRDLPSGGNIYNEQLIAALRKLGQAIEVIDFASYHAVIQHDKGGIYGVDSLFVEEMLPLTGFQPKITYSFFILHHLNSMYPPAGIEAGSFFETYEKEVLQFFQAILMSSQYSKEYVLQKGITAPLWVVEPASTAVSSASPLALSKPTKALMVANVVARKGILSFLEALSSQADKNDAFVLSIIGRTDMEPAYFDACMQCVESSGLEDRVHFVGVLKPEDTLKQYAQHHIFISAAYMETFGMAIQEAKAHGLPLLLCKGGYAHHHLTQGSGMLCANTFKLAGNFIELCRNGKLMQELWQSAMIGRKIHEAYTWNHAAAHFLNLFRDFL